MRNVVEARRRYQFAIVGVDSGVNTSESSETAELRITTQNRVK
jgi:hypothetical protein